MAKRQAGPTALLALTGLVLMVVGCDDEPMAPSSESDGVTFVLMAGGTTGTILAEGNEPPAPLRTIQGANGELVLVTMHATLEEFAVEGDRAKLEVGPLPLEIPLEEGSSVPIFTAPAPPGLYEELELEVAPLKDKDPVVEQFREEFGHWPKDASLRVMGAFTPHGGEPRPFVAFIEAEVEVELEFDPLLAVSEDRPDPTVAVTVDPTLWFKRGDGAVVDLSAYHCDPPDTCSLPELEVEIEAEGDEAFLGVQWN